MEKPMTKEIAIKLLASKEESLRDLALLYYPELSCKVKSYEHALELLGRKAVDLSGLPNKVQALVQLSTIVEAYNLEGSGVAKYYPWFEIDKNRDVQALNFVDDYDFSIACVPAPTLFKSSADCKEAVEAHFDLFKEVYSLH